MVKAASPSFAPRGGSAGARGLPDAEAAAPVDLLLAAVGGLPWLAEPLGAALTQRRAHALLVHGPDGVGQFEFALALARAWLCEAPAAERPDVATLAPSTVHRGARLACGRCAGCRLVDRRSHPDLRLIVPEALRGVAGLAGDEADEAADAGSKKRKPSREIKVEQIRAALDFSELSGARSGLRVIVLHPAEQLNAIAANALLKTLEEPAGDLRFILSCGAPAALLPTVRSRCQSVRLGVPARALGRAWLQGRLGLGVDDADALLDACGDQPLAAQALVAAGLGAPAWRELPGQIARGDTAALAVWPLPEFVLALQKLCVDLTLLCVGAPPRYFAAQALAALQAPAGPAPARGAAPGGTSRGAAAGTSGDAALQQTRLARLTAWAAQLRSQSRSAEHPWSAPLAIEALVIAAQRATLD
jgi:DNA polymerase-3 subunit delta'